MILARFSAARAAAAWLAIGVLAGCASAGDPSIAPVTSIFPMGHYDQRVETWIPPSAADYDQPFLSAATQREQSAALLARYFGDAPGDPSPWNPRFIEARLYRDGGRDIAALQIRRLARYDNRQQTAGHIVYGQNLRPHADAWIAQIATLADPSQFTRDARYRPERRAIATDNLLVRSLPTDDPAFYSAAIAGEGYPFDNLQETRATAGSPLYLLGVSRDGAWRYVQTPDVQGWVHSAGVGLADSGFVEQWRAAARLSLGVVLDANLAVVDSSGTYRFNALAGSLLPRVKAPATTATMIPMATQSRPGPDAAAGPVPDTWVPALDANGHAVIHSAYLGDAHFVAMPWVATPRHLAQLLDNLIGRPYGWGNTGFYNDCSAELQSIFATFGVWLPRHSSNQMDAGQMVDLSPQAPPQRIAWLAQHGKPYRTLIYIGGHVMLYLGNTTRQGVTVPMVYQDVWGLRPTTNTRRAVIGGSVIMPLDARIPEDPTLRSLAATPIFQVSIIGDAPLGTIPEPSPDDAAS